MFYGRTDGPAKVGSVGRFFLFFIIIFSFIFKKFLVAKITIKTQKFWKNVTFFAEKFGETILTYFQKFSAKIFRFWSKKFYKILEICF